MALREAADALRFIQEDLVERLSALGRAINSLHERGKGRGLRSGGTRATRSAPETIDSRANILKPLAVQSHLIARGAAVDLELVKMKVCMVGEAAVGKTSLVRRFVLDIFNEAYAATLGARVTKRELHFQGLEVPKHVRVDMTLWDIMGERFVRDELRESYLLGAQAVIAVADIARPSTMDALETWIDWVRNAVGDVPVVYAVNKIDLLPELMKRPNDEEIEQLFGMKDVFWFYTSAKAGQGVEEVFTAVARQVLAEVLDYQLQPMPKGARPSSNTMDVARGAMGT